MPELDSLVPFIFAQLCPDAIELNTSRAYLDMKSTKRRILLFYLLNNPSIFTVGCSICKTCAPNTLLLYHRRGPISANVQKMGLGLSIQRTIGLGLSEVREPQVPLFGVDNAVPGNPNYDRLQLHMKNYLIYFRQQWRFDYKFSISTNRGELMLCDQRTQDRMGVEQRLGIKCAKIGYDQDILDEGSFLQGLRGCEHIAVLQRRQNQNNPYLILDIGFFRTVNDFIGVKLTDAELWSMFLCCE